MRTTLVLASLVFLTITLNTTTASAQCVEGTSGCYTPSKLDQDKDRLESKVGGHSPSINASVEPSSMGSSAFQLWGGGMFTGMVDTETYNPLVGGVTLIPRLVLDNMWGPGITVDVGMWGSTNDEYDGVEFALGTYPHFWLFKDVAGFNSGIQIQMLTARGNGSPLLQVRWPVALELGNESFRAHAGISFPLYVEEDGLIPVNARDGSQGDAFSGYELFIKLVGRFM